MNAKLTTCLIVSSMVAFCCGSLAESATAAEEIGAPVFYDDLMLVLVTPQGVAAVVFTDTIDREGDNEQQTGVGYRFRYESKDGKKQLTGEGEVFEKRVGGTKIFGKFVGGKYAGGDLEITAGPIKIVWSYGSHKKGWIYYTPENMQVHIAHAEDFEQRVDSTGRVREKLDLKRFMKKPE